MEVCYLLRQRWLYLSLQIPDEPESSITFVEERNVFVKPRAEPSLLELCYGEKTKDEIQRIFDDMNNGFGWDRLPKSFMAENTVFLLLTALIRNFYKAIIQKLDVKKFGLNATSRIKAFVFRFISVPAKWIRTSRRYVLNIYTCNNAYADVFQTDFG